MLPLILLFCCCYIYSGCTQSVPVQQPVQPQTIYVAPIAPPVPVSVVRVRATSASLSSEPDDGRPMTLRQAITAINRKVKDERKSSTPSSHATVVLRSNSSSQPGLLD